MQDGDASRILSLAEFQLSECIPFVENKVPFYASIWYIFLPLQAHSTDLITNARKVVWLSIKMIDQSQI